MIGRTILIALMLASFAILVIAFLANARKQKIETETTDAFGDYPHMSPLDAEWMKRGAQKRSCICNREPRGA
jgi:hypothetical protein